MKLKKVIINGKECYVPEDFSADEIEIDDEDQTQEEKDDDKTTRTSIFTNSDFSDLKQLGSLGKTIGNTVSVAINSALGGLGAASKKGNAVGMLPFMDDEELHEVAKKMAEDSAYCDKINPVAAAPFLDDDDVDLIFEALCKRGQSTSGLLPFVSDECLHKIVQQYVKGEEITVDINALYPFLDSKDVKALFDFEMQKK